MSLPLYFPGQYFFYPIGNTPAVSLTRNLPPDIAANILLLPCGDPRNVLYTIFNECPSMPRKLDFTCVDYDPGILARDILLYTMIMDDVPQRTIWEIYLNMYISDEARQAVLEQCRKMIACSRTSEDWHASSYGAFLRMGTEHTLVEVRRAWRFYRNSSMPIGDPHTAHALQMVDTGRTDTLKLHDKLGGVIISSARSSRPLLMEALEAYRAHFSHYWRVGQTPSPITKTGGPSCGNPTFLYSRLGEGFRVHYGTAALAPFHLAPLFGNHSGPCTIQQMATAAQAQFDGWCLALKVRTNASSSTGDALIIRFIVGDALHVAAALANRDCDRASPLAVSPWTATPIELLDAEYRDRGAPTLFDVVDTSNLSDHAGLLNILLCSVPLLSASQPWCGVLYTEFLLAHPPGDTTIERLWPLLPVDVHFIALLLGICPIEVLSGFSTTSDTHEVLLALNPSEPVRQFHLIVTWKGPYTADTALQPESRNGTLSTPNGGSLPLDFNSEQLASFLYATYTRMFGPEDPIRGLRRSTVERARSGIIHNSRETFVIFLHMVRERCSLPDSTWTETMENLLARFHRRAHLPFDNLWHQDLSAQLYRHHVYAYPVYHRTLSPPPSPSASLFSGWSSIPHLVRIFLTVPHDKFSVLRARPETPPLHCVLSASGRFECGFQSVDACFGSVSLDGSVTNPQVVLRESSESGLHPDAVSPLVFSFVVPSWILTDVPVGDTADIVAELCVKSTPATAVLAPVLGMRLSIFAASITDKHHVHVVPEVRPSPRTFTRSCAGSTTPEHWHRNPPIGVQDLVQVQLGDPDCATIATLSTKLHIRDTDCRAAFAGRAMPTVTQPSPFTIRIGVGKLVQSVAFPLPVLGGKEKVRLARRSSYIEVVIPTAMSYPDTWALETNPFPIVRTASTATAWNIHRVLLDRMPAVDVGALTGRRDWLNAHVSLQMSQRERKARAEDKLVGLGLVKDTIHAIMVRFTGVQGGARSTVFSLSDERSGPQPDDMVLFVSSLRYDLGCHTILCDAFVLPSAEEVARAAPFALRAVARHGIEAVLVGEDEMRLWRRLLPSLVERSRATWTHGKDCEHTAGGGYEPSEYETAKGLLCSCGRGQDVDGMRQVKLWKSLAPFVTRIALSPLFAVPYLEQIIDSAELGLIDSPSTRGASAVRQSPRPPTPKPSLETCATCAKADGSLRRCGRCKAVVYCSESCQKADWAKHKLNCTARR
ncbi:hypothetical protein C8Q77DRAFT_1061941 [Trametes polyzona]|nr:hypothetical protein C8Q77DRAFT_1061941 [Trametes polyzona]